MKKGISFVVVVMALLTISSNVFASRWELVLNDGWREFHLKKVETIGGTDIFKGRVDNGEGEDQDVILRWNESQRELAIDLLGDERYWTESLVGAADSPLAADGSAIGPFVEVLANGQIQTNVFIWVGPLPPVAEGSFRAERRSKISKTKK